MKRSSALLFSSRYFDNERHFPYSGHSFFFGCFVVACFDFRSYNRTTKATTISCFESSATINTNLVIMIARLQIQYGARICKKGILLLCIPKAVCMGWLVVKVLVTPKITARSSPCRERYKQDNMSIPVTWQWNSWRSQSNCYLVLRWNEKILQSKEFIVLHFKIWVKSALALRISRNYGDPGRNYYIH